MSSKIIDYLVIGAGFSGMSASLAIKTKHHNLSVVILEKNVAGQKIKVSGNGRCNIGHLIKNSTQVLSNLDYQNYIFSPENIDKYNNFISNTLNLILKEEDGLLYPYSKQSVTVLNAYLHQLKSYDIPIIYDEALSLHKQDDCFICQSRNNDFITKNIIISTGSKSYYKEDNSSFISDLANRYKISFSDFKPGLTGFIVKENIKDLFGLRLSCKLSLVQNNKIIFNEVGEVQFKKDGVSGIVVMNSSNIYAKLLNKSSVSIVLDIINDLENENIDKIVNSLDTKIISYIRKQTKNITIDSLRKIRFNVLDTYGFEYSQISIGGVSLSEVDEHFMSNKVNGLYFIGEILDVDGFCGGYNIMNAIISAILMAEDI